MALSNIQIERFMRRNTDHFYKVFPYDKFRPEFCPFLPCGIIVNTEPQSVEFGHWVAIFIDKNRKGSFFDSFGCEPWGRIARFFEDHAASTEFNKLALQTNKTSCGHHAIFFLTQMSKGYDLGDILRMYHSSPKRDFDAFVLRHYKTH